MCLCICMGQTSLYFPSKIICTGQFQDEVNFGFVSYPSRCRSFLDIGNMMWGYDFPIDLLKTPPKQQMNKKMQNSNNSNKIHNLSLSLSIAVSVTKYTVQCVIFLLLSALLCALSFLNRPHSVIHCTTTYDSILQRTAQYYSLLQSTPPYYKVPRKS